MLIVRDLNRFSPDKETPLILALGNFDGIHRGHQALLKHAIGEANRRKGKSAVLSFEAHPQHILHPESKPPLLTSQDHRLFLLNQTGIDICFLVSFTKEFSKLTPHQFVRDILVEKLHISEICLGDNARFGYKRQGNATLLKALAKEYGFQFTEIKAVEAGGDIVSSSRIRRLIQEGKLEEAETCLGRPLSVLARVIPGKGRGTELGFPTANLDIETEVLPPFGVYPVYARAVLNSENYNEKKGIYEFPVCQWGAWFEGVMNFGVRPTFQERESQGILEIFLLDFQGDLYQKTLEVVIFPRIREERTFPDAEDLKRQIQRDIQNAREFLKKARKKAFTKIDK
ncbi:MAG: bifunctional riboflavin kinase/FAD synthetase [Candidatus Omnitrophica bacterium]|nr:bifunctional riboflavin kinase/FAD synthetase [Candidatus Omnitrophota bacterium]